MRALRLRRARATPAEDDARALAAANRRVVELEARLATQLARADRACGRFCRHAAQLADSQWTELLARTDAADAREQLEATRSQMRDFLDRLRDYNAMEGT